MKLIGQSYLESKPMKLCQVTPTTQFAQMFEVPDGLAEGHGFKTQATTKTRV